MVYMKNRVCPSWVITGFTSWVDIRCTYYCNACHIEQDADTRPYPFSFAFGVFLMDQEYHLYNG